MSDVQRDTHGGKIRETAARLGLPPTEILDFSANISFLGPLPPVVAAARHALDTIAWYPEERPLALRRAAAGFLSVSEDQVILGNGASELIFLTVAALAPNRVLVIGPTFTEYERAALAWGAEVDRLLVPPSEGFALSAARLEDPDFRRRVAAADLVFLCDPNNPTGSLLDREVRDRLIGLAAEAGTLVFVDESFLAFTETWPEGSATRAAGDTVLVLHSFTKLLAVPGLRVGALVAPTPLAGRLEERVPPWNINCAANEAALAGLAEPGLAARTIAATAAARRELAEDLRRVPGVTRVLPAAANFLCLELAGDLAGRLAEGTARRGVLVRDLSDFPGMGPRYLRVAVRSPEENTALVEALGAALGELVDSGVMEAAEENGRAARRAAAREGARS